MLTQTRCVAVASCPPSPCSGEPLEGGETSAPGRWNSSRARAEQILDSGFWIPRSAAPRSIFLPLFLGAQQNPPGGKTPLAGDGASTPWARTMRQLPERSPAPYWVDWEVSVGWEFRDLGPGMLAEAWAVPLQAVRSTVLTNTAIPPSTLLLDTATSC